MKLKATKISKTRAAGLAAATRGRSRQFADRADILARIGDADADAEIGEGVEEYRRRHQVSQNQEERR